MEYLKKEREGWLSWSLFQDRCLLLADVFQKFINTCFEYYGLDTCHYFSSPGLNWDAMLEITEIELKLISDIDLFLFVEKVMSGGISTLLKYLVKSIIYTWNHMAKASQVNILHIQCQQIIWLDN